MTHMTNLPKFLFALFLIAIFASCSSSNSISSITAIDYRHIDIVLTNALKETDTISEQDFEITSSYTGFSNAGYSISSLTIDPEGTGDRSKIRIELNKCMLPIEFSFKYGGQTSEFAWDGRVAFVTSAKGTGDFKTWENAGGKIGLDAADAVCQAEADGAGLNGTFTAWLSDRNEEAKDRIGLNSGGWIRTDGFPFALSMEALIDATLPPSALPRPSTDASHGPLVPLCYTAEGALSEHENVRTNTYPNGTIYSDASDCSEWNSSTGSASSAGKTSGASPMWTYYEQSYSGCDDEMPIYCFQTGDGAPEIKAQDYQSEGKKVFITSTLGCGGDMDDTSYGSSWGHYNGATSGLDGADLVCQHFATEAGLDNPTKFKAWFSDDASNMVGRFNYSGPWVLLNGVKIADTIADLIDGRIFTPINVNEDGERQSTREDGQVLTGTDPDGNANIGYNCNNWTSNNGATDVTVGTYFVADQAWTEYELWVGGCAAYYYLYCFEDE